MKSGRKIPQPPDRTGERALVAVPVWGILALVLSFPSGAWAYFGTTPVPGPVFAPRIPEAVYGGYSFPPVLRTSFDVTPPAPKKPLREPFRPGLRQIGAARSGPGGDYTVPVRGFGRKEPIREVLAQLLGPGWTVLGKGVAPGTEIDWVGGRTLPRTLDRIARMYGWRIVADWTRRSILLERPGVVNGPGKTFLFRTKTEVK